MKKIQESLYEKREYKYPALDFVPNIRGYLHENEVKPSIIVVPGGGYSTVSPTEAEIVANKFFHMGFHTFVVTYTTDVFGMQPLMWQPAQDLAKAVIWVRRHAEELGVKKNNVAICGFSAGAHLCGSLAVNYERPELKHLLNEVENINDMRPDGVILCYPVITSGEYAHKDSFIKLLGLEATSEMMDVMSIEKQVKNTTPPIFLWHTMADELVPVENSLLMAKSCKDSSVICELHLFPQGKHGMSLADDTWATGQFGEGVYTMYQLYDSFKMLEQNSPEKVPKDFGSIKNSSFEEFMMKMGPVMEDSSKEADITDSDIAKWPELATAFLERVWKQ